MNHTDQNAAVRTEPRTEPRTDYAPTTQERTHTTQSLAELHAVKPQTISSWVARWLTKVAPESLLKIEKGIYTELTHTLLQEFIQVDERERHAWVADAKSRYSSEWGSVGVIDCEIMPKEVGGTLALLSNNLQAKNLTLSALLAESDSLITELSTAEANFSQAELDSWQANGAMKGAMRFKVEEVTAAQTFEALRQRRLEGGQS